MFDAKPHKFTLEKKNCMQKPNIYSINEYDTPDLDPIAAAAAVT